MRKGINICKWFRYRLIFQLIDVIPDLGQEGHLKAKLSINNYLIR